MSFLRRWFSRKPSGQRRELQLLVVDQQCLRALIDARRSLGDDEVAQLPVNAGAAGYVRIAAALLAATFGTEEAGPLGEAAPA